MARPGESGYVLTEVLVASAIAAAVIATAMSGMTGSLRAGQRAAEVQSATIEAQNIAARLRAGLAPDTTAELYPEWQIAISPVDRPVDPRTGAVLSRASLTHTGVSGLTFEIIYLEAGQLVPEGG
ncbi:hypothetical protein [Maricaulis sp.]|uniref:hypothetical protein n=1 Tax=Maricaulis sp. TaxID=1486257 RepID=UPI002614DB67|nr:hypothetical protein [Maricaulis sp.]